MDALEKLEFTRKESLDGIWYYHKSFDSIYVSKKDYSVSVAIIYPSVLLALAEIIKTLKGNGK